MKYVKIDQCTGEVTWDAYFAHLRSIQERLPLALYSYASNWEHYSLDGTNSLHDAWLISAEIGFRNRQIVLELLGPSHDRKHVLSYFGVERYKLDLDVTYKQGDRDVLAHEFTVEDRLIVHEMVFANCKSISISATNIVPRIELVS